MKDKSLSWEQAVSWLKEQPGSADLIENCYYDDPILDAAIRYRNSDEWVAARKLIGPVKKAALDMGAGRGISSYALAKDGWDVVALEPDTSNTVGSGAIRMLVEQSDVQIDVIEDNGETLPFKDNQFDLVYCRAALHHAKSLQLMCSELGRVLRPGGVFLATREHVISRKQDLDHFLDSHPLHHLYGGENAYLLDDYISAIQNSNITLNRVLNPYQTIINMFPDTPKELKRRLCRRIFFPLPDVIPDWFIGLLGARLNTPGRLYSFLGVKKIPS